MALTRPITDRTEHYTDHGGRGGTAALRRRQETGNDQINGTGSTSSSPQTRRSREQGWRSSVDVGRRTQQRRRSKDRR